MKNIENKSMNKYKKKSAQNTHRKSESFSLEIKISTYKINSLKREKYFQPKSQYQHKII